MKFNTIRFKISVLYTTILGIVIIIYTSILYVTLYYNLYNDFDSKLMGKVAEIKNTIDSYLNILGPDQQSSIFSLKRALNIEARHPEQGKVEDIERFWLKSFHNLRLGDDYINFLNAEGESIVLSPNLDVSLLSLFSQDAKVALSGETAVRNIKYKNLNLRLVSMLFSPKGERQYVIQIASSLKPVDDLMRIRLYYRLIPIPIFLLCGYFIGLIFVRRILRPVAEITTIAERITHKDLSKRVETKHIDEEMRSLVNAFNDMISRLEKSFKYIGEFSSHVSHELKTPLAIIRGEIELALRKEKTGEEYKRVLAVSLEEIGRMLRIIEDLLLLTKLDYRPDFFVFRKFDLIDFFGEIYEQSKLLASEKNIIVNINMPRKSMVICADKIHLRRLFFNLMDNAIKFTPPHGRINITVKSENKKAIISISDTGIGIKENNLPKIFDKFFCGEAKAQSSVYGSGLGLSIAQSIAKIHNGNIRAESQFGKGATFIVTLPLA